MSKTIVQDQIPAYSEVMEDHAAIEAALAPITDQACLCVASGGDNVFQLVLAGARQVLAVDLAAEQIELSRWKLSAITQLDQTSLRRLAGLEAASAEQRWHSLRSLSIPQLADWEQLVAAVSAHGLLGCGKLSAFLAPLRAGLSALVGTETLERLLTHADPAQRRQAWTQLETPAVIEFLSQALNQHTISDAFIPASAWPRMAEPRFHLHYLRVLRHLTQELDPRHNFYLQRLWLGRYVEALALPPYLTPAGQKALQARNGAIEWLHQDLGQALEHVTAASLDCLNLSNVLDWCSDEHYAAIWLAATRAAKPGARCFLRSFLIGRPLPASVARHWQLDEQRSRQAGHDDRVGYFSRYELWRRV